MSSGRTLVALSMAIAVSVGAGRLVAQGKGTLPSTIGDLNVAQLGEVRDQAGQVLLTGTLKTTKNKAKETERNAELRSPTGQQKAEGKVDVDIERKDGIASKDEIELEVEHLPAMTSCEVFIDGIRAGSFVTSKSGKGQVKLER